MAACSDRVKWERRENVEREMQSLELLNFLLLPKRQQQLRKKPNERREIKSIVRTLLIKENAKKDFNFFSSFHTHYEILAGRREREGFEWCNKSCRCFLAFFKAAIFF